MGSFRKISIFFATCGLALAQSPQFRSDARVVLVPVTVTDKHNQFISGLEAGDFELLDNGVVRKATVELADAGVAPFSLVVAIQTAGVSTPVVAKVRKMSAIFQPVIAGANGEIAVVTFDEEVRWLQDFTADDDLIRLAIGTLRAGAGISGRMLDAVGDSVRRMVSRKGRKVVLLISESKDRGSKLKLQEALDLCGTQGVQVFAAHYSAYVTPFTAKSEDQAPVTGGPDLLAAIGEITRNGKANTVKALAQTSGGEDLSFATQRTLETIIQQFGQELHSQYLLSFSAAGTDDSAENRTIHEIRVRVISRPELRLRYRRAY